MRLSKKEIRFLKEKILQYFPDAKIYIFGSILNDNVKGGDVDIFIITDKEKDFEKVSFLKFELENYLLRKVDLIFHKDFNLLIEKEARRGVEI